MRYFIGKFAADFAMAFCSFGSLDNECGATPWAVQDAGMIPLLSCDNDMTAWLKEKYKGSGASGTKGRPGSAKGTGEQ